MSAAAEEEAVFDSIQCQAEEEAVFDSIQCQRQQKRKQYLTVSSVRQQYLYPVSAAAEEEAVFDSISSGSRRGSSI